MSRDQDAPGALRGARRLDAAFFARPSPEVARDLVGALLVRADDGIVVRLVETEAYLQEDPACHAYGSRTARNEPLWRAGGHAYVYFSYGMHWCLNTSTGSEGHAQGVLLRAAEPLRGMAAMRARRGRVSDRDLLRGPARLAQALGLDGSWSGMDLCAGGVLHLADDGCRPAVEATPRTGVSRGADLPWRFVQRGSRWTSPHRRSPRAAPPGTEDLSSVEALHPFLPAQPAPPGGPPGRRGGRPC